MSAPRGPHDPATPGVTSTDAPVQPGDAAAGRSVPDAGTSSSADLTAHVGTSASATTGGLARPLLALLVAAICAAITALLAQASVSTARGQRLDQLVVSGAKADESLLTRYGEVAVGTVSAPVMAVLLGIALVLVLMRRDFTLLLPLAVLVAGANLTTQVLKHVVVVREVLGPGIEITPNSFPSGHTTLAASAMVSVVRASGRARALLAPLGALWAAAVGIGTVVVGWHRPSDVIGAIVIVAAWTFLVLAVHGLGARHRLARARARSGHGRRRLGTPAGGGASPYLVVPRPGRAQVTVAVLLGLVGLIALALGAVGVLALRLPLDLQDPAQQDASFRAVAALIGGGTASWMALVLILSTPTSHRRHSDERVP